jgi:serine O-acetyltransferase
MRDARESAEMTAFRADTWRQFGRFSWMLALRGFVLRRNYRAITTLRLCHRAASGTGWFARPFLIFARLLHRMACHSAGIDLPWQTRVGGGLALTHGWGLVVNENAVIGRNVTMLHGATLGQRDRLGADGSRSPGGSPTIEDEVWIGPHAIVVGPITVGRGSRIAGGACVFEDVPPRSIVVGNPARVVKSDCTPDVMNAYAFDATDSAASTAANIARSGQPVH